MTEMILSNFKYLVMIMFIFATIIFVISEFLDGAYIHATLILITATVALIFII